MRSGWEDARKSRGQGHFRQSRVFLKLSQGVLGRQQLLASLVCLTGGVHSALDSRRLRSTYVAANGGGNERPGHVLGCGERQNTGWHQGSGDSEGLTHLPATQPGGNGQTQSAPRKAETH